MSLAATGFAQEVEDPGESLWKELIERYEVIVLSRGVLLEPLDAGSELQTIEVGELGIAINGETVTNEELAEQIGEEDARLVERLAELSQQERRELAGLAEELEPAMVPSEPEVDVEAEAEASGRKYRESQVSIGNSLTVERDEVTREAVVFGGPLVVYGKVAGDAVAIGGSVTVEGEVTGDVAAVAGSVTIREGAEVMGEAVSVGGQVEVEEGGVVRGQIVEVPFGAGLNLNLGPKVLLGGHDWWRDETRDVSAGRFVTRLMWKTLSLLVFILVACLVLLIARSPLERVRRRAVAEPWKSGLTGLATELLIVPLLLLLTIVLLVSIIGIPLLLLLPFAVLALVLVALLGYCAVAFAIGEFLESRFGWKMANPYVVMVVGVLAIQFWSFVGDVLEVGLGPLWFFAVMFGIVGFLVKYTVWTIGLGAGVLTRFATAESWGGRGGAPFSPGAEPASSAGVSGGVLAEPEAPVEPDLRSDFEMGDRQD